MSDLTNEDESPVVTGVCIWDFPCADYHAKCQASYDMMKRWKLLGDHQVMNLQKELQRVAQERDDLKVLFAESCKT